MKQKIGIVMIVAFIGKIAGFIKELVLAYYYGATKITDAYILSQEIPGTLFQFVGMGLSVCYISIYVEIKEKANFKELQKFTNKVFSLISIFTMVLIVGTWVFIPQMIGIFAAGINGEALDLACNFTRIGIFSLVFAIFTYTYNAILNANGDFRTLSQVGIVYNFVIIVSVIVSSYHHDYILIVGSTLATLIQALLLKSAANKYHFRLSFDIHLKDKYINKFFRLFFPMTFGVLISQLQTIIDKNIASFYESGSITILNYANSILLVPVSIFGYTMNNMYYPVINKEIQKENGNEIKSYLDQVVKLSFFLLVPSTVCLIIFRDNIVSVLFGHGVFEKQKVLLTARVLSGYAFGIMGLFFQDLFSKCLYAFGKVKITTYVLAASLMLNLCLNVILSKLFGILGIALATSVVSYIVAGSLWCVLKKQLDIKEKKTDEDIRNSFIKIVFISIIMGVLGLMFYKLMHVFCGEAVSMIITIIVSVCMYMIMTYIAKVNYIKQLFIINL